MTKNLLLFIAWISCSMVVGNENFLIGTRQAGMSNTGVMFPGLWSVSHNQAGLGYIENMVVGMHHENRYLLKNLNVSSLAFAVPSGPGTLATSVQYFRYSKFHQYKIGLAYGKSFGEKLAAGIQLDYFNRYIAEGYGNENAVTFEAGLLSKPIENLYMGAHVFNPVNAKMGEAVYDKLPMIFRFGIGYCFADKLLVGIENEKQSNLPSSLKAGIEYEIISRLKIRAGMTSKPVQNSFGVGYQVKNFTVDIAFSYDQVLGSTPHFSLKYDIGHHKK